MSSWHRQQLYIVCTCSRFTSIMINYNVYIWNMKDVIDLYICVRKSYLVPRDMDIPGTFLVIPIRRSVRSKYTTGSVQHQMWPAWHWLKTILKFKWKIACYEHDIVKTNQPFRTVLTFTSQLLIGNIISKWNILRKQPLQGGFRQRADAPGWPISGAEVTCPMTYPVLSSSQ